MLSRWLPKVIMVVVFVTTVLGAAVVWTRLDSPIQTVQVQGPLTRAEQNAVREVVARALPAGLLGLEVETLRRDLGELSWPRSVTVRRVWPATLVIEVEKEMVIAAWGDSGYLTSAAQVVALADRLPGVPRLSCELTSPGAALEVLQRLRDTASGAGLTIAALTENGLGEWEVEFNGGTRVKLGSDRLAERMLRFIVVYQRELESRLADVGAIDARYPNGVAVRWRGSANEDVRWKSNGDVRWRDSANADVRWKSDEDVRWRDNANEDVRWKPNADVRSDAIELASSR